MTASILLMRHFQHQSEGKCLIGCGGVHDANDGGQCITC